MGSDELHLRLGFEGFCNAYASPSTLVTEEGSGWGCGARLSYQESPSRLYSLGFEYSEGRTEGKYTQSGDVAGVAYDAEQKTYRLHLDSIERSSEQFGLNDELESAFLIRYGRALGFGDRTHSQEDQMIEGEGSHSFADNFSSINEFSRTSNFSREWRWGRGALTAGPSIRYRVSNADDYTKNRVSFDFMLQASYGIGDSVSKHEELLDEELAFSGVILGFYNLWFDWRMREQMNANLSDPQQDLNDYMGDGMMVGDSDSMATASFLNALPLYLGASDSHASLALHAGSPWFELLLLSRIVTGAASLSHESTASKVAGGSDMFAASRMALLWFMDVATPERREGKRSKVKDLETLANIISYLAGAAVLVLGASDDGTAMRVGAGSNLQVCMSPDPLDYNLLKRTEFGYGLSAVMGENGGTRGSFVVHNNFEDSDWFTEARLSSPIIGPSNASNAVEGQDDPYKNTGLDTSVAAIFGKKLVFEDFRLRLGVSTEAIFGPSKDRQGGIGALVGAEIDLGENVTLGADMVVSEILPVEEEQVEGSLILRFYF